MTGITQVFLDSIERRDHSIMRRVHKWPAPKWVRLWMICATRGGDGWLWYALGAALLIFGGPQGRSRVGAGRSGGHRTLPGLETRGGPQKALRD